MALIKFDRRKLLYGDIKPEKVVPIKYQPYEKNAKGSTVVDLNKSAVDSQRKLLSLYTSKTSQLKFNQVIDIEFQDFPVQETDNSILLLQTRLNALLAEKRSLLTGRDTDQAKIDELNRIIEELRRQLQDAINEFTKFKIENTNEILINEIPDSLSLGAYLGSDRLGRPGDPGFPKIENQLLSKNRKAKLVIQSDGNCVITKGDYDIKGNVIGSDAVVDAFGWDEGASAPNFVFFYRAWSPTSSKAAAMSIGGVRPVWRDNWRTPIFDNVSSKAKVVLEDSATISIYDGDRILWSSFGIDMNADEYNIRKVREAEELKRITDENARRKVEQEKLAAEQRRRDELAAEQRRKEEARIARESALRDKLTAAKNDTTVLSSDFRSSGINYVNVPSGASTRLDFQRELRMSYNLVQEYEQLFNRYPELNDAEVRAIFRNRFFSDSTLKTDINLIGQSPSGINIYSFKFKEDMTKTYQGVIADELLNSQFKDAVSTSEEGYLVVDYNLIDVDFVELN